MGRRQGGRQAGRQAGRWGAGREAQGNSGTGGRVHTHVSRPAARRCLGRLWAALVCTMSNGGFGRMDSAIQPTLLITHLREWAEVGQPSPRSRLHGLLHEAVCRPRVPGAQVQHRRIVQQPRGQLAAAATLAAGGCRCRCRAAADLNCLVVGLEGACGQMESRSGSQGAHGVRDTALSPLPPLQPLYVPSRAATGSSTATPQRPHSAQPSWYSPRLKTHLLAPGRTARPPAAPTAPRSGGAAPPPP